MSSLEVIWPALLLGPHLRVGVCVLFKDFLVVALKLFPAECTNGLFLGSLDWVAIGFDGNASACGLSLFVLAVNAVFLGDRHDG